MKILVLGGRVFLGRHVVHVCRERGHTVTLFNRGKSNPELFPDADVILGDREKDLDRLSGRTWDAVIDTCGYVPRVVGDSATALVNAVGRYVFVSTLSVYPDITDVVDESSPVGTLEDEATETVDGETYGPLKALCERTVDRVFGERALHVRAGLIVGPNDPTDRFTYWPVRAWQGGPFLAPGDAKARVQFIDVRDLADWIVAATEAGRSGAFNVTGPAEPLTMRAFVSACAAASPEAATPVWVDDAFLTSEGVEPWTGLPLWLAGDSLRTNIDRVRATGITYRPLETTIRDTAGWAATRPADHAWRAGLPREREQALLDAWRKQAG